MSILAVETLLVAIDHRLPVELSFVTNTASMGQLGEVHCSDQRLQIREELVKGRCLVGDRSKEEPSFGDA